MGRCCGLMEVTTRESGRVIIGMDREIFILLCLG